jgi:hypothetical protein
VVVILPPQKATKVLLLLPHWFRPLNTYNMTIVAVNDCGQIDRTYNETITVTFEELRVAKARRLNEPPPAQSGYEIAKIEYIIEMKNGQGHFIFNPEHYMYVNYKIDSEKLTDSISTFMVGITIY